MAGKIPTSVSRSCETLEHVLGYIRTHFDCPHSRTSDSISTKKAIVPARLSSVRIAGRNSGAEKFANTWTAAEDQVIADNISLSAKELENLLPRRTEKAISHRRLRTGLRKEWAQDELETIRNNPHLTAKQIHAELPHRSVQAIRSQRFKLGLRYVPLVGRPTGPKPNKKLTRTGNPVVDAVITRCEEDGISLSGLDRELGTGHYFQSRPKTAVLTHIAKAVAFFGGRALMIDESANITIDWNDE
jgi:hypothetical protein